MLSLGPAGGCTWEGWGKGARRGGCFTGGGGACLGHPWPWWAVPLRLSAFLCRGGLLSVLAASVAVVGVFFAPVGFSLPWWAVVSPGGIRGRGGRFLCACRLFFAVVGCCQSGRHPWPWWAVITNLKSFLPVAGCLFGGCRGHDPRRRACLPLHPVLFSGG